MITGFKVNDRVKQSAYALRSKRDYWLGLGDYTRKQAAKASLDKAIAERGTVIGLLEADFSRGTADGLRVQWDNGAESRCLPGMVEIAED